MAYKKQKPAQRWGGLSASKQQQVQLDARRQLQNDQQSLAAAQQQLAANKASMDKEHAQMVQQTKEQRRQAEAVAARGRRCEAWANEMVHGESGELLASALQRATSKAAVLRDAGIDSAISRHVAVAQEVETTGSVLAQGSRAWYTGWNKMAMHKVTVVAVHWDDPPDPYYTVCFEELGGGERSVSRDKLVPRV